MEYNLLERSIDNAISRGDVELLVSLFYKTYFVKDGDELRDEIDEAVPEIAHLNGLQASEMSFKEFVIDVYDITQAQEAYTNNTVGEYLAKGGIAHARAMAKVLLQEITKGIGRKFITTLSQVLLKLNGKFDQSIEDLTKRHRKLVSKLCKNDSIYSDYLSTELFLRYPSALVAFKKWYGGEAKADFFRYYISKYYPTKGVKVLKDILQFLRNDEIIRLAIAADTIVSQPGITIEDEKEVITILKENPQFTFLNEGFVLKASTDSKLGRLLAQ